MTRKIPAVIAAMVFCAAVLPAQTVNEARVKKMFSSLDYYSCSVPYTKNSEMYLGYEKTGRAVKGVAVEKADIYKKITIIIGIDRSENRYSISYLNVPDINKITDTDKRKKLTDIVNRFKGSSVEINNGKYTEVDAVSGATRFVEKGYETINRLINSIISEMEANPDWEKKKINS